ncbi:hypothetical protein D6D26_08701 [Aureobasidium pullulans]|nr:hypothetical protein D6D26_08701 [Aureobasidium pullulans]
MLRADNQATPVSFKSSTRNQKVSQLCTSYISHIAISHACCIPLAMIPLCKGELSARQQRQHGFLRSPPSAYSHTFHVNLCVGQVVYTQNAALRTPAMCYTRSFGVEDFLASLLNMREATCQCLEHSSNLSTHTYSTVVFLQPRSPIRVLSLSYILDQITSTRSKNSNCTYPANVSMSMRFQVWISSVPSLASVSGKLCEDSSCRLQRTRTVSAHIISRRIQPTLRGVLHFCKCGLVGSRPLWSCISPRESPITGGVVIKG